MKQGYWVLCIIAVALLMRLLFGHNMPAYRMSGDSVSYFLTAKLMLKQHMLVDHWRTPVYPLILAAPFVLSGQPLPETLPIEVRWQFALIRIVQAVSGIIAIALLFFLLLQIGLKRSFAGVICLFMACNRTLIIFEANLLTEAFATLWLMVVVYLVVLLLKKFDWWKLMTISILFIIGVFLRPSYIAFPFVLLGLLVWYYPKKIIMAASAMSISLYLMTLVVYTQANALYFQYPGISRISDVNILGKILKFSLPLGHATEVMGIKQLVNAYMVDNPQGIDPWQIYVDHPELYNNEYAVPMHLFVGEVLRENIVTYIVESTKQIPTALTSVSEWADQVDMTRSGFGWFFDWLQYIYHYAQTINLIVIVTIPLTILEALRKKTFHNTVLLLLALTIAYHVGVGVYLGYADFGRHLGVMQPLIYSFSFIWWGRVLAQAFRVTKHYYES
jgi:hypothetical protein